MSLRLEAADLEPQMRPTGEEERRQQLLAQPPSSRNKDTMPPLSPPKNFAMVVDGVYRSALPKTENFEFVKTLALRSILYLCPEEYPEENKEFVRLNGIRVFQFGVEGNKDPVVSMPMDTIMEALLVLINSSHHPILIHCKSGKHRTGCLVGCFRILQDWGLSSVHEEYRRHAAAKARIADLSFIEGFNIRYFRRFVLDIIFRIHGFGSDAKRLYNQQNS